MNPAKHVNETTWGSNTIKISHCSINKHPRDVFTFNEISHVTLTSGSTLESSFSSSGDNALIRSSKSSRDTFTGAT